MLKLKRKITQCPCNDLVSIPSPKLNTINPQTSKKQKRHYQQATEEYRDMFSTTVALDDNSSIQIAIKRGGDLGLPMVDIRLFSDFNSSSKEPTKKGVSIPLENFPEVIDGLKAANLESIKKGYYEEVE